MGRGGRDRWWRTAGRVLVVLGWLLGLLWLAYDVLLPDRSLVLVAAITGAVTGLLVDRWWSVVVPLAVALGISVWAIASQNESQEVAGIIIAAAAVVVAAGLCVPLLLGVGLRRLRNRR